MVVRRNSVIAVLLAVLVAVTGCAKSAGGPEVASLGDNPPGLVVATPSATPGDRTEQLRQFAQCMRDKGVDVKDPQPGAGLGGAAGMGDGIDQNDPRVVQAYQACQSKLPGGSAIPRLNPQQVELYRQFAQCIRDHGVDLPDPTADGTLQAPTGGLQVLQSPEFQAALAACRDKLTGLLPSGAAR